MAWEIGMGKYKEGDKQMKGREDCKMGQGKCFN
jgi:hypothetical protein